MSLLIIIISSYIDLILIKIGLKKEEEFVKHRKKACNNCPYKVKKLGIGVCGVCDCVIQAKAVKIYSKCPNNLWQE